MKDSRFALLVTIPVAIFLIAWSFYPMAFSFWLSLQEFQVRGGVLRATFVGLTKYVEVIGNPQVQGAFIRTLEFVVMALPTTILIALGVALLINEAVPGSSFIKVAALLPWAVSDYGTGELWRFVWAQGYGAVNTFMIYLGLTKGGIDLMTPQLALSETAIAEAWHIAPLGAFFILASLQVIPEDLYRQARIDGANAFNRFKAVTLPFIRYAVLITVVISTVFTMEVLDTVLTMTGGGPGFATQLVTYQIYQIAFINYDFGGSSAASYLLLIAVAVMATLWFRLLIRRH